MSHLRGFLFAVFSALFLMFVSIPFALADSWPQQPTQEELTMTSQAEVPGTDAVYLYWDESSDDREGASSSAEQMQLNSEVGSQKNFHTVYVRLKILTEAGKRYADVPILYPGRMFSVANVEGRTIHSDGTVIPFTGKPFQKEVYKTNNFTENESFFTMPDVQVGSIL